MVVVLVLRLAPFGMCGDRASTCMHILRTRLAEIVKCAVCSHHGLQSRKLAQRRGLLQCSQGTRICSKSGRRLDVCQARLQPSL